MNIIQFEGVFGYLFEIVMWIVRLIILNFLWIIFSVLGIFLFGIAPASLAMANVIYKWFSVGYDINFVKIFVKFYFNNFIKANKIGLIVILFAIFLWFDLYISENFIRSALFHAIIVLIIGAFTVFVSYLMVIFCRYELKFSQYFKQALLFSIGRPMESIGIILTIFLLAILYSYIPILLFFMGISLSSYPIIGLAYHACLKVERKIENKTF
ncbi:YesL family protein [Fundicoccus culcitae]|uniref:DUF624 domain-containing protein n=1 Tax=Fundicoccus culcitae TaxID=2969821 RepID=A0ABY5P8H4_9LACT|nr:DUF624 domain-containing protein [Fundicoccus culcitae]UUX35046.1 DUF624 domain-containing protein [Fundicoccus culcitae]